MVVHMWTYALQGSFFLQIMFVVRGSKYKSFKKYFLVLEYVARYHYLHVAPQFLSMLHICQNQRLLRFHKTLTNLKPKLLLYLVIV